MKNSIVLKLTSLTGLARTIMSKEAQKVARSAGYSWGSGGVDLYLDADYLVFSPCSAVLGSTITYANQSYTPPAGSKVYTVNEFDQFVAALIDGTALTLTVNNIKITVDALGVTLDAVDVVGKAFDRGTAIWRENFGSIQ